jgi:hypothetical protein
VSIELNHTIVRARDKATSAEFLARILGLPGGPQAGPFLPITLANRVTPRLHGLGRHPAPALRLSRR